MNILIFNWRDPKNPRAGGAEVVTLEYVRALIDKGHNVTWLATKFSGSNASEKWKGIQIVRRGNPLTEFFLFPVYYLWHKKNFSLVIEEIHGLPYLTPLYVRKKKLVFIHEVAGDIWNKMYKFPFNKIGILGERLFFQFYKNTQFFTVSQSTKKDLQSFGIRKISVITNGISVSTVTDNKESEPTFIFLSRLVKMKGVEDILLSFSSIREQLPRSQLWIVGEGESHYVSRLKAQVELLQIQHNVTFFGRVSDKKRDELLRKAHLLLHASVKEGWGLVVFEAAAQYTPAVVYNVSGLSESVIDNQTGIILKKNTPDEMAEATVRLYSDKQLYSLLQENGYKWALDHTWANSQKQFLELIDSL